MGETPHENCDHSHSLVIVYKTAAVKHYPQQYQRASCLVQPNVSPTGRRPTAEFSPVLSHGRRKAPGAVRDPPYVRRTHADLCASVVQGASRSHAVRLVDLVIAKAIHHVGHAIACLPIYRPGRSPCRDGHFARSLQIGSSPVLGEKILAYLGKRFKIHASFDQVPIPQFVRDHI